MGTRKETLSTIHAHKSIRDMASFFDGKESFCIFLFVILPFVSMISHLLNSEDRTLEQNKID